MSPLSILLFPFMMIFFFVLDAGKNIFLITLFGIPSLFLLATFYFFLRRRKNIVFTALFYMSLFVFVVFSVFLISILSTKGTYHPAVGPKDGVKAYIIDYPRKGLDNMYKLVSLQWEGKGEKYVIQGWLDDDTLVYKKWQGWTYLPKETTIGPEQVLQYSITTKTSSTFSGKIEKLENKTCEYETCIKDLISTPVYSPGCRIGYVSPNGKRVACISAHTYGPQDIIIFEK